MQVLQRQLRRSLHMKKIIANALLQCFTSHSHSIQRALHTKSRPTYIIANSRNSCLPTRIHSVQLQEPQKTFYIKFKQKNDWHMNSFIHCGSEKRVYRFPSGNKLADAREGGGELYGCIITL